MAGEAGHGALDIADAWVDPRTAGIRLAQRSTLPLLRIATGPGGFEVYAARHGDRMQLVFHAADPIADDALASAQVRGERVEQLRLSSGMAFGLSKCSHVRVSLRAGPNEGATVTLRAEDFLPPLHPPEVADGGVESPEERASRQVLAMRRRPFDLSVSATRSSSDPVAVITTGLAWAGPETPGGG